MIGAVSVLVIGVKTLDPITPSPQNAARSMAPVCGPESNRLAVDRTGITKRASSRLSCDVANCSRFVAQRGDGRMFTARLRQRELPVLTLTLSKIPCARRSTRAGCRQRPSRPSRFFKASVACKPHHACHGAQYGPAWDRGHRPAGGGG